MIGLANDLSDSSSLTVTNLWLVKCLLACAGIFGCATIKICEVDDGNAEDGRVYSLR